MEVGGEGVLYIVRYFQVKWLWQQIAFNIILVDNTFGKRIRPRATVSYYLSTLGQAVDSFIVPVDLLVQLQLQMGTS